MAMDETKLKNEIEVLLAAAGFNVANPYSRMSVLTTAIATAVVNHIRAYAKANITYGNSSGEHPIV